MLCFEYFTFALNFKQTILNTTVYKNAAISYTDQGQGKTIVLLHGFLENKNMWIDLTEALTLNNRVITIDLLGHGNSECLGYIHTMEEQGEVVNHILSELQIEKATFIGHSMGGYVALAFAEKNPSKINGLVLLNSTAKEDNAERKKNRDRAIIAVKHNFSNFISMSIANLFSEKNREQLTSEIEFVKKEALKTPLQGVVAALEGMKIRKDRVFLLDETTFPILSILGKNDPVLPFEENQELILKTKAQLHIFEDGHMSSIENKAELPSVINDFLRLI